MTKKRISNKMTKSDIFARLSENQAQKRSMCTNNSVNVMALKKTILQPPEQACLFASVSQMLQDRCFTARSVNTRLLVLYWHSWAFVYPPLHRNVERIASWMHHVTVSQRDGLERANQKVRLNPANRFFRTARFLKRLSDSFKTMTSADTFCCLWLFFPVKAYY